MVADERIDCALATGSEHRFPDPTPLSLLSRVVPVAFATTKHN